MFVLVVVIEEVGVTAVVEGLRSKRCHNGRRHQRNETRINTYPACTRHGLIAVSSGSCGLSSVVVFNVAERKCSRKPTHTRGTLRTRQLEDGKPCEQSEKIVGISHDLSFVQVMVCNGDVWITGNAAREMTHYFPRQNTTTLSNGKSEFRERLYVKWSYRTYSSNLCTTGWIVANAFPVLSLVQFHRLHVFTGGQNGSTPPTHTDTRIGR